MEALACESNVTIRFGKELPVRLVEGKPEDPIEDDFGAETLLGGNLSAGPF